MRVRNAAQASAALALMDMSYLRMWGVSGSARSLPASLKDREGDLPIGTRWGLLFDREQGSRRDPDDGKPSTPEQLAELRAADPAITQAAAAEAIGVTEQTIRTYWKESGEQGALQLSAWSELSPRPTSATSGRS